MLSYKQKLLLPTLIDSGNTEILLYYFYNRDVLTMRANKRSDWWKYWCRCHRLQTDNLKCDYYSWRLWQRWEWVLYRVDRSDSNIHTTASVVDDGGVIVREESSTDGHGYGHGWSVSGDRSVTAAAACHHQHRASVSRASHHVHHFSYSYRSPYCMTHQ